MAAVSICSDFGAQEKNIQILELKEKSLNKVQVSLRFEKLSEYTKFKCKFKMAVRVTDLI